MFENSKQQRTNVDEVLGYSAQNERKINRDGSYLHKPTVVPLDRPLSLSVVLPLCLTLLREHTIFLISFCCRSETRIVENCPFWVLFCVCDAADEHNNNHHYRQIERAIHTHYTHTHTHTRTAHTNVSTYPYILFKYKMCLHCRCAHTCANEELFFVFFFLRRIIISFSLPKFYGTHLKSQMIFSYENLTCFILRRHSQLCNQIQRLGNLNLKRYLSAFAFVLTARTMQFPQFSEFGSISADRFMEFFSL